FDGAAEASVTVQIHLGGRQSAGIALPRDNDVLQRGHRGAVIGGSGTCRAAPGNGDAKYQ
ncbi:MAG: hypothetical protein NXI11_06850, partial [Proteobacteria bacterium]|nr:hypothetical protein [Pseudomonadota bacterium]